MLFVCVSIFICLFVLVDTEHSVPFLGCFCSGHSSCACSI